MITIISNVAVTKKYGHSIETIIPGPSTRAIRSDCSRKNICPVFDSRKTAHVIVPVIVLAGTQTHPFTTNTTIRGIMSLIRKEVIAQFDHLERRRGSLLIVYSASGRYSQQGKQSLSNGAILQVLADFLCCVDL